jgi:hypothetical protein
MKVVQKSQPLSTPLPSAAAPAPKFLAHLQQRVPNENNSDGGVFFMEQLDHFDETKNGCVPRKFVAVRIFHIASGIDSQVLW